VALPGIYLFARGASRYRCAQERGELTYPPAATRSRVRRLTAAEDPINSFHSHANGRFCRVESGRGVTGVRVDHGPSVSSWTARSARFYYPILLSIAKGCDRDETARARQLQLLLKMTHRLSGQHPDKPEAFFRHAKRNCRTKSEFFHGHGEATYNGFIAAQFSSQNAFEEQEFDRRQWKDQRISASRASLFFANRQRPTRNERSNRWSSHLIQLAERADSESAGDAHLP